LFDSLGLQTDGKQKALDGLDACLSVIKPEYSYMSLQELCEKTRLPKEEIIFFFDQEVFAGFQSILNPENYYFESQAHVMLRNYIDSKNSISIALKNASSNISISSADREAEVVDCSKPLVLNEPSNVPSVQQKPYQTDSLVIPTEAIEEDKSGRYRNIAIEKVAHYCQLKNNFEKGRFLKTVGHTYSGGVVNRSSKDYVTHLELNIVPVKVGDESKGFRLDLRGKCSVFMKVISVFDGQKRIRLDTLCERDAHHRANTLIHEKCIEKSVDLLPDSEEKCLEDILTISNKCNRMVQNRTEGDMMQYVSLWQHIAGKTPLKYIDDNFVLDVIAEFLEHNYNRSTVHHYCCELRKTLELAKKRKWITEVPTIPSFQSDVRDFIDITPDKFREFRDEYCRLAVLNSREPGFEIVLHETFLEVLRHTGQRLTSTKKIDISNIDFERKVLRIPKLLSKAKVALDIPLSDKALSAISTLLVKRKEYGIEHDCLFSKDNNGSLISVHRESWKYAALKAELTEDLTRHHFRHYFITTMLRDGASYLDAKIAGGFTSSAALLRYLHCTTTKTSFEAVNSIT
jgi:site-specific recombinase XerD